MRGTENGLQNSIWTWGMYVGSCKEYKQGIIREDKNMRGLAQIKEGRECNEFV